MKRTHALALLVAACASTGGESNSAPSGSALFRVARFGDCHGGDLAGTDGAPSLLGLAANWQRDALAEFLNDPAPVMAKDARLAALDLTYSAEMPGCPDLTSAQREALAGSLLTR